MVNGKVYIGQSRNIENRFKDHRTSLKRKPTDKRSKSPMYDDMRLYGLGVFEFEVLEECSLEQLDEREEHYISLYDAANNGYNRSVKSVAMRDENIKNQIWNDEARKKQGERMKVRNNKMWEDEEYKKRRGQLSSELQKERLKDPEYLAKKSADLKKATDKMKKHIAQYTLDGELVATYEGLRLAERTTGISIHQHLRHPDKRKQAGGFVWKYIEQ